MNEVEHFLFPRSFLLSQVLPIFFFKMSLESILSLNIRTLVILIWTIQNHPLTVLSDSGPQLLHCPPHSGQVTFVQHKSDQVLPLSNAFNSSLACGIESNFLSMILNPAYLPKFISRNLSLCVLSSSHFKQMIN